MFDYSRSHSRLTEPPRPSTTLLATCWGITSAYILFHSLLVSHDMRPCLAAIAPLIITWATLERKRWGRLALLGLSAAALGMFVGALGLAASIVHATLPHAQQTPLHCLEIALGFFGEQNPYAGGIVIALAAMTGLHLQRPTIVAEFERGKNKTMATAQRGIAALLVCSWGLTFVGTPMPRFNTKLPVPHQQQKPAHHNGKHPVSKRSARSAASASNL